MQEPEPLVLQRRHHKTIAHKPHQTLEIEWRGCAALGGREHVLLIRPGHFLVELVDFEGEEVVFAVVERLLSVSAVDGCEGLGRRVCYASQDLYKVISSPFLTLALALRVVGVSWDAPH